LRSGCVASRSIWVTTTCSWPTIRRSDRPPASGLSGGVLTSGKVASFVAVRPSQRSIS
jgi:hypothetical protein